jgi:O-antigen/teichoic acid export membrane protein
VVGTLAGRVFGVAMSYALHPMRPRLTLCRVREIFGVSQWMLVRGIGTFLGVHLHKWIVGGRESAAVMGGYTLANEISSLPGTGLLGPLNRVLFPAFVKAKENVEELRRLFVLAQSVQAMVGIPMSVGIALVASEVVPVLLGEQWRMAIPFVQWVSVMGVVTAMTTSGGYVMVTLGQFRTVAVVSWINVALFAAAAIFLLPDGGAMEIIWLRNAFAFISLFTFPLLIRRALPAIRFRDVYRGVTRPVVAALVMSGAVLGVPMLTSLPLPILLLAKIATGTVTYIGTVVVLWWVAGRPEGAEAYLLRKVLRRP